LFYPSAEKIKLEDGGWEEREELISGSASTDSVSSRQRARLGATPTAFS